jgi:hypothetical protein
MVHPVSYVLDGKSGNDTVDYSNESPRARRQRQAYRGMGDHGGGRRPLRPPRTKFSVEVHVIRRKLKGSGSSGNRWPRDHLLEPAHRAPERFAYLHPRQVERSNPRILLQNIPSFLLKLGIWQFFAAWEARFPPRGHTIE